MGVKDWMNAARAAGGNEEAGFDLFRSFVEKSDARDEEGNYIPLPTELTRKGGALILSGVEDVFRRSLPGFEFSPTTKKLGEELAVLIDKHALIQRVLRVFKRHWGPFVAAAFAVSIGADLHRARKKNAGLVQNSNNKSDAAKSEAQDGAGGRSPESGAVSERQNDAGEQSEGSS